MCINASGTISEAGVVYHDVEPVRSNAGVAPVEAHSLEDPLLAIQYHTSCTAVESEIIQDESAVESAGVRKRGVIESNRNTRMTSGEVRHVEDDISQLCGLTNRPVDVTNSGGLVNVSGIDYEIFDRDVEVVSSRLDRIFGKDDVVTWEI
jgi:hypothetical protein